jgi:hypothetical protein
VEVTEAEQLNIVSRLGGFHTLMSFLRSIGSVMAGSGLVEVLECCYGSNTVCHMISGKAYDRAIRGHLLIESALHTILIQSIIDGVDGDCVDKLPSDELANAGELPSDVVQLFGEQPGDALSLDELPTNELPVGDSSGLCSCEFVEDDMTELEVLYDRLLKAKWSCRN